jgi:hypothetical protein
MGLVNKRPILELDCVICLGQSNEEGGGDTSIDTAYQNSQPNTYIFYKPDNTSTNNGKLQKYHWGVNSNYRTQFYASPDCSIGIKYHELTGKPLLIIKYALGGSAMVDDGVTTTAAGIWQIDANSTRAGGLLHYNIALNNFIIPCINFCKANNIKLNILATNWCQGETDSTTLLRATNYESELIRLFDALQTALIPYDVLSPNYKPLITRIHNNFTPGTRPYLSTVRTALENVATHYGGQWINTDAYSLVADLTHWDKTGQQTHGIDRAQNLYDYYQ